MNKKLFILFAFIAVLSCKNNQPTNGKPNIVTTTTMITDLVKNIGGKKINVQGLMGSGVDPHLFKASEGDVSKLANADALDKTTLIASELFPGNYDPHIWFNIDYWIQITQYVADQLSKTDPENKLFYETNAKNYIKKLEVLKKEITATIQTLPKEKRILVTAHDAFSYFGKAYDFEVVGLQGLSTATEAGVQDVQKLATFIIDKKVKAIFVESSVPKRTIEALQAAVTSKGHDVSIGGTLYSDALGNSGSMEGTYIGMFQYNVNTIVNALK